MDFSPFSISGFLWRIMAENGQLLTSWNALCLFLKSKVRPSRLWEAPSTCPYIKHFVPWEWLPSLEVVHLYNASICQSLNARKEESQFEIALCSLSCCYIWGLFWRKLPICGNCSKVATYQEFFNLGICQFEFFIQFGLFFNFERTEKAACSSNYNLSGCAYSLLDFQEQFVIVGELIFS